MRKIIYFVLISIAVCGLVIWAQAQNNDSDTTAPAAISDLAVSTTTVSSITLTWTAPGDDNMTGTSTSYDLRYATTTITNSNWDSVTQAEDEPTPQIASSTETMTVSGLEESTTYYFAIKAEDEENNQSALSNVISGTTLASEPEPEPEPELSIGFEIKVTPQSLNLSSQGNWISIHLFVPAPYRASQIDIATVELNDSLLPDLNFKGLNYFSKGNKNKERNTSNLVLKFSRSGFVELVGEATGDFEVTMSGEIDGETFSAADTIDILSIAPEEEETLVMTADGPEVYIIKNNRKRHIPSVQAFNRQNFAWQNVKRITAGQLNSYPDDELIKASDNPAVYLICAGMKRHIPSPEVFESYGFDWNNISVVSSDELVDYADVNLIRAAGDTRVYRLAGNKRHWIPTLAVFNKHGYKWDNVIIVNLTERDALSEDENVE